MNAFSVTPIHYLHRAPGRPACEYQETLAIMVDEGERLARMVSSMLFLARADNARQVMTIEPVSIAQE